MERPNEVYRVVDEQLPRVRPSCYGVANQTIIPKRGAVSVVAQLILLIVLEFWVGVAIGWIWDRVQRSTDMELLKKTELTPSERGRLAWQAAGVTLALALCFIGVRRIIQYVYLVLHCRATTRVIFVKQNTTLLLKHSPDSDHDAFALHGGFAMFYGLAWTSGTTVAQLNAAVN